MMRRAWKHLDRPDLGFANRISTLIAEQQWRTPASMPQMLGDSLVIGCDFAGESKIALYRAVSIVVAEAESLRRWEGLRAGVRGECFTDARRIAYKSLRDRQRAKALMPFLRVANSISGVIYTLLIDNRINSLFREDRSAFVDGISTDFGLDNIDAGTRERLLLLSHQLGLVLSGLTQPDQSLLVVCDEDSIFANEDRHRMACDVMSTIGSHYMTHPLGSVRVATTKSDTGRCDLEDYVAIADLVVGALVECAGLRNGLGGIPSGIVVSVDQRLSCKCRAILGWLAEDWHPLKRWTIRLDHVSPDKILARWVTLQV